MATLENLRTQTRQRADIVHSTFIQDGELNNYINAAAKELYDLILSAYGEDYYVTSSGISLTGGTDTYALPGDFYKLAGVDLGTGSNTRSLRRSQFSQRNNNRNNAYRAATYYPNDPQYRIQGSSIVLSPAPGSSGSTLTVWYHPTATTLSADDDTFDGINGWEEYIVVDAAIRCMQKEESDTRTLERQKSILERRIMSMAEERDAGQPYQVTDVAEDYEPWPWG